MAANIATIKVEELIKGKPQLVIRSPYNAEFVAALKEIVPSQSRKWDGMSKAWTVAPEYGDAVAALMREHYGVIVDERESREAQVEAREQAEDAALNAEIEQIKANQEWVREHKSEIEAMIAKLDSRVKGYSYKSVSNEKAAFASDAALLRHALVNAEQPVEQLVEVQVRGLAAVVRRWQLQPNERNSFWYRL